MCMRAPCVGGWTGTLVGVAWVVHDRYSVPVTTRLGGTLDEATDCVGWRPRDDSGRYRGMVDDGWPVVKGRVLELASTTVGLRPPPGRETRVRQSADRLAVAQRMVSEAVHPSRLGHVPAAARGRVLRGLAPVSGELRAAETVIRGLA